MQSGSKGYWFKVDEKGEIAGGIAKFVTGMKDKLAEKLCLAPNTLVVIAAGALALLGVATLCHKLREWAKTVDDCEADTKAIAAYLTVTTGKTWATDSAYGYCQGEDRKSTRLNSRHAT